MFCLGRELAVTTIQDSLSSLGQRDPFLSQSSVTCDSRLQNLPETGDLHRLFLWVTHWLALERAVGFHSEPLRALTLTLFRALVASIRVPTRVRTSFPWIPCGNPYQAVLLVYRLLRIFLHVNPLSSPNSVLTRGWNKNQARDRQSLSTVHFRFLNITVEIVVSVNSIIFLFRLFHLWNYRNTQKCFMFQNIYNLKFYFGVINVYY